MISRTAGKQSLPYSNVSMQTALPGANANGAVTFTGTGTPPAPGTAPRRWVIHNVVWSYAGGAVTGRLQIADNASPTPSATLDVDITATGPGVLGIAYVAGIGASVTVTLFAGGAGVTGKLHVEAEYEDAV